MADLRRDDPSVAVARRCVSYECFRGVVAVTFRGVDEVDADLAGLVEHPVSFRLREVLAPFPAELPGAHADDRHAKIRPAEPAIFHSAGMIRRGDFTAN